MLNRVYKILIIGSCLVFVLTGIVNAATSLEFGSSQSSAGETVTLAATLQSDKDIAAVSTDVSFNASLLSNPRVQIGPAGQAADKTVISNLVNANTFRIGVLALDNNNTIADGVLFYVRFDVSSEAASGTQITINHTANASDPGGNAVAVTSSAGAVRVTEADGENDGILLYNPTAGRFYLKNDLAGGAADVTFQFGPRNSPWKPTAGDWNGSGQSTVGLFNPVSAKFFMKNSHSGGDADIAFSFGPRNRNWIPISGDWNGDGQCDFGLYDPTKSRFFLKTSLSGGQADYTFQFGPRNAGWLPIAGDWDGDGLDSIGLYSPRAGKFHLNNTLSGGAADMSIRYGAKNSIWLPVCGDWDGDGSDEIGLYNPAPSKFFLKNDLTGGEADIVLSFGPSGGGWLPGGGFWE